jgi:hypothetical protein
VILAPRKPAPIETDLPGSGTKPATAGLAYSAIVLDAGDNRAGDAFRTYNATVQARPKEQR